MKILYVEDNERFSKLTTKRLLSKYYVTIAASLAEARVALLRQTFDIILIDYDLGDGKGNELVREVQAIKNRPLLIAISSHEEGNKALLQAGADAVCSKGDFPNIERVIEQTIRTRSQI
jgi:DNA-binding response OmpR family regulator